MTQTQAILAPSGYFASMIYTIEKPEFLDDVNAVSNELLEVTKKAMPMNETYPSIMTGSMVGVERTKMFEKFIVQSAWTILDNQGYKMDELSTYCSELWCQEHFKYSGMEQHVHPYGVVLSGFYFLTSPENGCMVELHDPRPGKVQASLPIKDETQIKEANNSLYIKPYPGLMVFSNSWLPHSFTRNSSNDPVKFIHFNISVRPTVKPAGAIVV